MAEEYDGTKPQKLSSDPPTSDEVREAEQAHFDSVVEAWLKGMKYRVYTRFDSINPITREPEPPDLVGRVATNAKLALSKPGTVGRERSENAKFVRSKTTVHLESATTDEIDRVGRIMARHDLGVYLTEHKPELAGLEVY